MNTGTVHEIENICADEANAGGNSSEQRLGIQPWEGGTLPLGSLCFQIGKLKQAPIHLTVSPLFPASYLTIEESHELQLCENTILQECELIRNANDELAKSREEHSQQAWQAFLKVGQALVTIRDKRLYRKSHATFADYCRKKWQYGKSHAYHLIGAAETVKCLSTMVDALPKNERQIRPLLGLSNEQKTIAWKKAIELAGESPMIGKHVKQAVTELFPKQEREIKRVKKLGSMTGSSDENWEKAHLMIKNALCFVAKEPENTSLILKSLDDHLHKLKALTNGAS